MAQTLEPALNVDDGGRRNGFHDHLGRLLDIDVAQWWRPDAQNFFGRVKTDVMLEALDEIGGPVLRGRYKDATKARKRAVQGRSVSGRRDAVCRRLIKNKIKKTHTLAYPTIRTTK